MPNRSNQLPFGWSPLFGAKHSRMAAILSCHDQNASVGAAPLSSEKPAKMAKLEDSEIPLRVKLLNSQATLPKRGSARAAGYDLARCVFMVVFIDAS